MDVFIIRPFGVKEEIDFDSVELKLIQPALKALGVDGSTTGEIIHAGNIRVDMFERLLMADLVIADITIHNANVFYELGVRQSLRDKFTFLIRGEWSDSRPKQKKVRDIPFDLKTDRYLKYCIDDPSKDVVNLVSGLKATIRNELSDSPIFFSLPNLQPQNPENFMAVPIDFGEEEEEARAKQKPYHRIGKLSLLASEVETYPWRIPALRLLGESLYKEKAYENAKIAWESVRSKRDNHNDIQANDRLSNIYQRLAEKHIEDHWSELLTKSDQALARLHKQLDKLSVKQRAEMFSLMARNAKTRWQKIWEYSGEDERQRKALTSSFLYESFQNYQNGYYVDLNHYYAGINALWMSIIIVELAERYPIDWKSKFSSEKKADQELDEIKSCRRKLSSCLEVTLDAADSQWASNNTDVPWHLTTRADLACLTETDSFRVANLYIDLFERIPAFPIDSIRRQLSLVRRLGIITENADAVLEIMPVVNNQQTHYLLFTGHMLDTSDRPHPRFPASAESNARLAIHDKLQEIVLSNVGTQLIGIAGGANGGDILFHEICDQLDIKSELFLLANRDEFVAASVLPAGNDWVIRFNELYKKIPNQQLMDSLELPHWLRNKSNYTIWERNNMWMLYTALAEGGQNMTLIALWDLKEGDGAGGTEHMVNQARLFGSQVYVIDVNQLY